MRKIDLTMILIFILSLVALLTTTLYAWFSLVEKTQPIVIYSGTVDLYAELYDKDNNKIINKLELEGFIAGDSYEFYLYLENRGTLNTIVNLMFNFSDTNSYLRNYIIVKVSEDANFNNVVYEKSLNGALAVSFDNVGKLGLTTIENKELEIYTNKKFYFKLSIKPELEYSEEGHTITLTNITITIEQELEGY